jgi:hypothetical protein
LILAALVKPDYTSETVAKVLSAVVIMASGTHSGRSHAILLIRREVTLTKIRQYLMRKTLHPGREVSHYPALSDSERFNLAVEQTCASPAIYVA